jgi:hypothetical protein
MRTRPLLIGTCVVLILWLTSWVTTTYMIHDPETRGQFGDQFGGVNALFSGLAFAVILAALLSQHDAAIAQKTQFELEMREASLRFEKQVELSALTAYADVTRALWESNRDRLLAADSPEERTKWKDAEGVRYQEMMLARQTFERILKERGILPMTS